jgi:hypothetical protein
MAEFNSDFHMTENFGNMPNSLILLLEKIKRLQKKYNYFPVEDVAKIIFGFSSKKANKLIVDKIFINEKFDWILVDKISTLSSTSKINKDLLFTKLDNYEIGFFKANNKLTKKFVFELLKIYPEKRVLDLIFEDSEFINDTLEMFNRIKKLEKENKKIISAICLKNQNQ